MRRREFLGTVAAGMAVVAVPAMGAESPCVSTPIDRVFADVVWNLRKWAVRTTSLKAYAKKIASAVVMEALVRGLRMPDDAEIQVFASKAGVHADFFVSGKIRVSDVFATKGSAVSAYGNKPVSILLVSSDRYEEAKSRSRKG